MKTILRFCRWVPAYLKSTNLDGSSFGFSNAAEASSKARAVGILIPCPSPSLGKEKGDSCGQGQGTQVIRLGGAKCQLTAVAHEGGTVGFAFAEDCRKGLGPATGRPRSDGARSTAVAIGMMGRALVRRLGCGGWVMALLVLLFPERSSAQTNAWTKGGSGNWEEAAWSLGTLPSSRHWVQLTNAGSKAVAISINTVNVAPTSLTVTSLVVNAPSGSLNTLLLNYSGVVNPLRVLTNCYVGTNGQLINLSGALRVENPGRGAFTADGTVIQAEGGQMFFQHAWFGRSGPATVRMTNGLLSANTLLLGAFHPVSVLQLGGTNTASLMEVNRDGSTYDFNGGRIRAGLLCVNFPDFMSFPEGGHSRFNQRGGVVEATESLLIGNFYSGTYTLYGGTVDAEHIQLSGSGGSATFNQGGGTNLCGVLKVGSGRDTSGNYHLTNGTLVSGFVDIGGDDVNSIGTFHQMGGVHRSEALNITGYFDDYEGIGSGGYILSGGHLTSTNVTIGIYGSFRQTGGTNQVMRDLSIAGTGSYTLGNGFLSVSNMTTSPQVFPDVGLVGPTIKQTGGVARVSGELRVHGKAMYELFGGNLEATGVSVSDSLFTFFGGQVLSNRSFRLGGASRLVIGGSLSLGQLAVQEGSPLEYPTNQPTIDFGTAGARVLRFAGSADVAWGNGGTLFIENWAGSLNGGGADRLLIGTNQGGVTAKQLAQIVFVHPAGLASGVYPARILGNGEIVPGTQPTVGLVRGVGNVQLVWATPFTLQTATNLVPASGWVDVPGARSPWTNLVNEPRRFFRLRK